MGEMIDYMNSQSEALFTTEFYREGTEGKECHMTATHT